MPIDIAPIGIVRSRVRDRQDAPRQAFEGAPEATLEIDPAFAPALHRITAGTELIVVTCLHRADRAVLQVHPRDDERIPAHRSVRNPLVRPRSVGKGSGPGLIRRRERPGARRPHETEVVAAHALLGHRVTIVGLVRRTTCKSSGSR